jgi:hypothetical protein
LTETFVAMLAIRTSVRLMGFGRTLRLLSHLSKFANTKKHKELELREIERLGALVSRLAELPVIRASCLPQALTLWFLLRRRSVDAQLQLGAAAVGPFVAHSWVEVEGRPVAQAPDVAVTYPPFPEVEARMLGRAE